MSSAATIHDGCGSLVHLLMLCIILIVICVLGMQPLHMYLYLTFVAHSYGKRYNLMQKYEKLLDYVSNFIIFCMLFPKFNTNV